MQHDNRCILIVDDEPGIRELYQEILQEEGYLCHTASNGLEALEIIDGQAVDLVMVDILMPGMTGISLFKKVEERHPNIPVIFASAVDDLDVAVDHLKSGAYDYILKPVTRRRLLEAVEASLMKHQEKLEAEKRQYDQSQALQNRVREVEALNRMIQNQLLSEPGQ